MARKNARALKRGNAPRWINSPRADDSLERLACGCAVDRITGRTVRYCDADWRALPPEARAALSKRSTQS